MTTREAPVVERGRLAAREVRSTTSFSASRGAGGSEVVGRHVLRRGRMPLLLLLLVAVTFVVGGCGSDEGGDAATPPTTSTSRSSITTTTVESERATVSAAYEAASRAFIEAAAIPDPDFPAIAATHTGPMLEQRRDVLRALKLDGRIIRYPANSQYRLVIESVTTEGDVSRVRFCAIDDGQRVDSRTGQVISGGVVTVRGEAALRDEGGVWKLAEQRFDSRTEGSASCE